jgi:hypothetical protein
LQYVDSEFRKDISNQAIADQVLARIDYGPLAVELNTAVLHQLKLAQPLSSQMMSAVWAMFEKRDLRICSAHKEVNSSNQNYELYKRSIFMREDFMQALEENPESEFLLANYFEPEINFHNDVHRLYCLVQNSPGNDDYSLVIIDFEKKRFYSIHPTWEINISQQLRDRNIILENKLNQFLTLNLAFEALRGNQPWPLMNSFLKMKFPPNQTDFDSGIYVFLFLYFTVNDCPIIFDSDDVIRIRKVLAYWLLSEYLPM